MLKVKTKAKTTALISLLAVSILLIGQLVLNPPQQPYESFLVWNILINATIILIFCLSFLYIDSRFGEVWAVLLFLLGFLILIATKTKLEELISYGSSYMKLIDLLLQSIVGISSILSFIFKMTEGKKLKS